MNTHQRLKAATVAASLLLLAAPGIAAADGSAGHGSVSETGQPKIFGSKGKVAEALTTGMSKLNSALQNGGPVAAAQNGRPTGSLQNGRPFVGN